MNPEWPAADVNEGHADFGHILPMPFPVNAPFRVRADLSRLESVDGAPRLLLHSDAQYARYARIKRAHLADWQRPLARVWDAVDPARVIGSLSLALEAIAATQPAVIGRIQAPARFALHRAGLALVLAPSVRVDALPGGDPSLVEALNAQPPVQRALAAISLAMQEDLVLMGWPEGRAGDVEVDGESGQGAGADAPASAEAGLVALAASVVFPSGWDPAGKIGRALWAIHAPVAEGTPLRRASVALSRAMVDKGPFERHVWTLTTDASLARWPQDAGAIPAATPAATPAESPDLADLVFRCERQVTLGMPTLGTALFLIRVHVAPLLDVCTEATRRARLCASLRSMSDEVVAYKHLQRLRERVLAAWG